jgi:hypothetical protein
MSLGVVLDVAIGLVFTYLLLALLASGLQELIAGATQLRGRKLRSGLQRLLSDPAAGGPAAPGLFGRVFNHALVQGSSSLELPSYVPARNISLALIDALMDGSKAPVFTQCETAVLGLPDSGIKSTLKMLLTQAGGDLDKFKSSVETWYDDAMDRVGGRYKRFSHYCLLALGLVLAVGLNVDTVRIASTLWRDAGLRNAVVQQAQAFHDQNDGASTVDLDKAQALVAKLPVPIGWSDSNQSFTGVDFAWAVLGWLVTAFAIALGAPFWFNALDGLLKLRSAGNKPARADDSK